MASIDGHMNVLAQSREVLGGEHPTTLEIWASLKLCFEEQLDWTLDDIPREHIDALDEIPRPPGHNVFWKYPCPLSGLGPLRRSVLLERRSVLLEASGV